MFNLCIIEGRFHKDPELRRTGTGRAVTSFALRVERNKANKDGYVPSDFIDCVSWDALAEEVNRKFHRNDVVFVIGRLQQRQWTDRDGNKHSTKEVIAEHVLSSDSFVAMRKDKFSFAPEVNEDFSIPDEN